MLIGQRENRLAIDDGQLESDFISTVMKSRPLQESTVNLICERGHITCLAGAIRGGEGEARKIERKKGAWEEGRVWGGVFSPSPSPGPLFSLTFSRYANSPSLSPVTPVRLLRGHRRHGALKPGPFSR